MSPEDLQRWPALRDHRVKDAIGASKGIAAYLEATPGPPPVDLTLLRVPFRYPNRMAFRLDRGDEQVVLKIDTDSESAADLVAEFNRLQLLHKHQKSCSGFGVIEPLWHSAEQQVLVTRFAQGVSLADQMKTVTTPAQFDDLVTRLGRWMRGLHDSAPTSRQVVWPGWALTTLTRLRNNLPWPNPVQNAYLLDDACRKLDAARHRVKGTEILHAAAHGDVNAGNFLITAEGEILGLDLGVGTALPVAQELGALFMLDIQGPHDPEGCAVAPKTLAAFQDGYGAPLDVDAIQLFTLFTILRRYLATTSERLLFSGYQRDRHHRIETRLRAVISG